MTPLATAPECDAWLQRKVEHSVDFLLDAVPPQTLEAIILTGSTARGEASVLPTDKGFRLLGDLEFLVIARAPFDWRHLRQQMRAIGHRATQDVGASGQEAVIEYGPAGRVYLQRNIRPCIFAYDLRSHGQVVWGQPDMLEAIAPFEVGDIPPEDALNLLMNRLVELLLFSQPTACSRHIDVSLDRAYDTVKLILELAGSALASTGGHVSRYRDRGRQFAHLLRSEPTLATGFSDSDIFHRQLDAAIACKLAPSRQRLVDLQQALTLPQLARWGCELWLWQIRRWLGMAPANFRDALTTYIKRESTAMRCKGWIKFFRHPLRPRGALSWPRMARLVPYASPQTLTYAMALLLLANLADAGDSDWEQQVRALSPIRFDASQPAQFVDAIGELWTWLIRNN